MIVSFSFARGSILPLLAFADLDIGSIRRSWWNVFRLSIAKLIEEPEV